MTAIKPSGPAAFPRPAHWAPPGIPGPLPASDHAEAEVVPFDPNAAVPLEVVEHLKRVEKQRLDETLQQLATRPVHIVVGGYVDAKDEREFLVSDQRSLLAMHVAQALVDARHMRRRSDFNAAVAKLDRLPDLAFDLLGVDVAAARARVEEVRAGLKVPGRGDRWVPAFVMGLRWSQVYIPPKVRAALIKAIRAAARPVQ